MNTSTSGPVQSPIRWSHSERSEEDQQAFYDEFANQVCRRLLTTARRRLADERHRDWQGAFSESGPGSAYRRARTITDDRDASPVMSSQENVETAIRKRLGQDEGHRRRSTGVAVLP